MTTRSSQLAFWRAAGTKEFHLAYQVPLANIVIVKSLHVDNPGTVPATVEVMLGNADSSIQLRLQHGVLAADTLFKLETWLMLEAGDYIRLFADAPGVSFLISGTVLPLTT